MLGKKEKKITSSIGRFIFLSIATLSLIAVFMLEILDIGYGYSSYKNELENIKENLIVKEQENLRSEIYKIAYQIEQNYQNEYKNFTDNVRQKALDGLKLASDTRFAKDKEQALNAVKIEFENLDDKNYLVYDYKNKNLLAGIDNGVHIDLLIDNALNKKATTTQSKANNKNIVSYAVAYEPLDIVVIYSGNVDEFNLKFVEKTKKFIKNLDQNSNKYLFLLDKHTNKILVSNNAFENNPYVNLNQYINETLSRLTDIAKNGAKEGFLTYEWSKNDESGGEKTSFVKDVSALGLVVGKGVFLDDIDKLASMQQQDILNRLIYKIAIYVFYFCVIVLLLLMSAKYIKDMFDNSISKFSDFFKEYKNGREYIAINEIEFIELQAVAHNINEIIRETRRLKSEKRQNALLLSQYIESIDGYSVVLKFDAKNTITFVNSAFCELLGFGRKELIGKSNEILLNKALNYDNLKQISQKLSAKHEWHGVIKTYKKDGSVCSVKTGIMPIFTDQGEILEFICICQDITLFLKQQEKLQNHLQDPLTKLPNRQVLIDWLKQSDEGIFVANFDILKFKQINEYYGFEMGDLVLIKVANAVKRLVENKDLGLYRLSDDNFAILGKRSKYDKNSFIKFCKQIIEYFKTEPLIIKNNKFYIEFAFGITSDTRLITAEMAKDYAKDTKTPIVIFEENKDKLINNVNLTQNLKRAIEEDRIVLYKQAIVDNTSNQVVKYECLIRMIDEERNVVLPINFLGIAKNSNLYQKLTKIVIEKSFQHFSKNIDEFSINLAIEDILSSKFLQFFKSNLQKYENIGNRLTIEIVEDEGIENFDKINYFIDEIRKFGCKVAIDDFGTGYSNFEYLMKIKADFIKIDGSMIEHIDENEQSRRVVELIVEFTKRFGIKTIAEFVHSNNVLKAVNAIGINQSQGFYFDRPKPLEA
ncbi:MAG: EAL domain-containing protein [Campylobacter sp.]|nr:EAL domain-containing protein [Campylobacter sp.]